MEGRAKTAQMENHHDLRLIEDDHFHDHCAVCGVYGHSEAAKLAYLSLYALQHRGQESAGIVSSDGQQLYTHKDMGLVQDIFQPQVLAKLPGTMAVGHTRYSTAGDKTLTNAQPIVIDCNRGTLALGHNGNLTNAHDCRKRLEHRGSIFQTSSDTEVIVHLLARSAARTLAGALADALAQVEGAYSLVLLTREELWAIRDPRGFRPLSLGRLGDAWLVASETTAFDLVGATYERDIEPGEMLRISRAGVESLRFGPEKPHQYCIFEHVYFSRPDSVVFGRPVNKSREELGRLLAREHPADADIVVPVPDSGVPAAIGYSHESGVPFRMGLIRNHYVGRTFIEPEQAIRDFGVKLKLNPVRDLLRRQARGAGGRFDRARHDEPQDRTPRARGGSGGSAHAHQLPADGFAVLLRRGHAYARRIDCGGAVAHSAAAKRRRIAGAAARAFTRGAHARRDPALPRSGFGGLSFARKLAASCQRQRGAILHLVLYGKLSDGFGTA